MSYAYGGGVAELVYLHTRLGSFSIYLTEVATGTILLNNFPIFVYPSRSPHPLTVGKEYRIDSNYEWYDSIEFRPTDSAYVTKSNDGGSGPRDGYVQFIPTSTELNIIILEFSTSA